MKFSTDHIFTIGDSHTVCEDYATSGVTRCAGKEIAYAIISDGCSSSENTDIGSRILSLCMIHTLEECFYLSETVEPILRNYLKYATLPLGIPIQNLDATLLCVATDGEVVRTLVWGDGFYVHGNDVIGINYPSGAPFYFSYTLKDSRKEAYDTEFGGNFQILHNGRIILEPDANAHPCVDIITEVDDNQLFLVASDGVSSYVNSEKSKAIPSSEIMDNVLAFKNFQGEFVRRRVNKMTKQFTKQGLVHYDDVSVAAIYIHREDNE